VKFQTKPQLAAEMLKDFSTKQQIPFRYVLADSVYTTSPEFIETVESITGVVYLGQAPENTSCWPKNPAVVKKNSRIEGGHGKRRQYQSITRSRPHSRYLLAVSMTSSGTEEQSRKVQKDLLNTNSQNDELCCRIRGFHSEQSGWLFAEH